MPHALPRAAETTPGAPHRCIEFPILPSPSLSPFGAAFAPVAPAADMNKTLRVEFRVAESGLRPAGVQRQLFLVGGRRDLRSALHVRLFRTAGAARPAHGGRAAADHRRRPHVHAEGAARHLLRRRPRVQGEEARARRRGLRLHDQADVRPEDPLVLAVPLREPPRRARRAARPRAQGRNARLRRRRSRDCRRSTATRFA